MVKIEIRTENVGGDEELQEALHHILDSYENDGETTGLLKFGGEDYAWAINPRDPLIGGKQ